MKDPTQGAGLPTQTQTKIRTRAMTAAVVFLAASAVFAAGAFRFTGGRNLADLVVTAIDPNPVTGLTHVTVKNQGRRDARAFDVGLAALVSTESPRESIVRGSARLSGVRAGQRAGINVALYPEGFSVPGYPSNMGALTAMADTRNEINESNESNNTLDLEIGTTRAQSQPDLIVSGMSQGCAPDGSAGVNVTVKNKGEADAGTFNVSTYGVMSDGTSAIGLIGGTWTIANLGIGETRTQQFMTTSAVATSGQVVRVVRTNADGENRVSESNETNNSLEMPFSPCIAGPIVINVTSPEWGNEVSNLVTLAATAVVSDLNLLPLDAIVFEIRNSGATVVAEIPAGTVSNNPILGLATGSATWNATGYSGEFTIYAIGSSRSWGGVRSHPVVIRVGGAL